MELQSTLERIVPASLLALGLGLSAASLAGCAGPEITPDRPATVMHHEHHDAYTSFILAGKVLVPIYHPEEFHLDLRQCERQGDPGADAEGCVTVHTDVSQQIYDQYPDGSELTLHAGQQ